MVLTCPMTSLINSQKNRSLPCPTRPARTGIALQDLDPHDRIPWVKRTNQPINYNDLIALTVLVSVEL